MIHRLCDWIGNVTKTIILVPYATRVGNSAEAIYYGLLKASRERKRLAILFPYQLPWPLRLHLSNIELVALESEYRAFAHGSPLYVIGSLLITGYFAFLRAVDLVLHRFTRYHLKNTYTLPDVGETTLWQPKVRMPGFSWEVVAKYDWPKQLRSTVQVSIGKEKRLSAERRRRQMGLPDDAWFVCLHVREPGFHNDYDIATERNANIINYIGAIEEITRRGGWVVRMGDATMTKLPTMERVIDYPFTEAKSDLMDVYLISECSAYIGTMSGILGVAELFQRPIILTNMFSLLFVGMHQKRGDIGLLKHVYSKSKNRFLSVNEWLEVSEHAHALFFLGNDYLFYENSPEELKTVVKEFFDRSKDWEPTPLQREFNKLRVDFGRRLLSRPLFLDRQISPDRSWYHKHYDIFQRYRFAARVDSIAVISEDYLRKKWDRDSREQDR